MTVQERGRGAYGQEDFPPRPASFEPDPELPGSSAWPYCAATEPNGRWRDKPPIQMLDYWFGFSDAGRLPRLRRGRQDRSARSPPKAFKALNSLRFDATGKPDWEASE